MVLVHGLLMTGVDLALLAHRLRRCGFDVRIFSYRTLWGDVEGNVARLQRFILDLPHPVIHLLGHSLGGLLIRHLLHRHPALPPGRVLTLGTPHTGSHVARRLQAGRLGRLLLGRSAPALLGDVPPWEGQRPLGSLAGSLSLGIGRLVRGLPQPNDGTVAVAETLLPGMADHRILPVSHTGLVFSATAARQACHFLRTGRFEQDA